MKQKSIIYYVHYNQHCNWENYCEKKKTFIYFYNKNIIKDDHSTWHNAYDVHEKQISLVQIFCIYIYSNNITHTMNWANRESQVEELAITNDTNIWMSFF